MAFVKGPICAELNGSVVNELVTVGEISSSSNTKYICPNCRMQLIAIRKNTPEACFFHRYNQGCKFDFKASLVKIIYDILEKEKKLYTPDIYVNFNAKPKELYSVGKLYNIDLVELVKKDQSFYPDIKINVRGKELYVYIKVVHDPSDTIKKYVQHENYSSILLDFTKHKETISKEIIRNLLFKNSPIKSWINNKVSNEWFEKFYAASVPKTVKDMVVYDCPDGKIDKDGNKIANIGFDCIYCPYCIQHGTENIYCTGDTKIATVEDLKKHLKMG